MSHLNPFFLLLSDSGDSGRIDYDEKAIMSLLDRNSSHDDAPDEEKDMLANEYLASFKVRPRPHLYGEKLSRMEGSLAYPSYPGEAWFSYMLCRRYIFNVAAVTARLLLGRTRTCAAGN